MKLRLMEEGEDKAGVAVIMLALKKAYEASGVSFSLCEQSSSKTQLSAKVITSGFMEDCFKFTEHFQGADFTFDEIYANRQKLLAFIDQYTAKKSAEYQIPEENILVTKLAEGSIAVEWASFGFSEAKKILSKADGTLKIHPFFQYFYLSPEDFDPNGNIAFQSPPKRNERRGGWPYYPPVHCKRYGIKVSGKYDDGKDAWLKMNGRVGEWAVGFHGVKNPEGEGLKGTVMQSIMKGLNEGDMLRAGRNQVYSNEYALNKPKEKVGKGVYLSPHFQTCLPYTKPFEVEGNEYRLMMQCRVNPTKIKVCSKEDFWVLNEPADIRPYGILLIKEQDKDNIESVEKLFGKGFSFSHYDKEIMEFLEKY